MRISYSEDEDYPGQFELWQDNCERSLRGLAGQKSLRELEAALLALPSKRLIAHELDNGEDCCAIGALCRMKNRVQISSDALRAYVEAVEQAFGANVDFAQIVKSYTEDSETFAVTERKYSAPDFVIAEKIPVMGHPNLALASTSHIERLNGTTRLHMRRLTRLTYAFSKKRDNFEAAVALHFAYYNFVKRHNTLRTTPAMAAGIEQDFWTVGNLIEAAA
jgi:hypothetical protein